MSYTYNLFVYFICVCVSLLMPMYFQSKLFSVDKVLKICVLNVYVNKNKSNNASYFL